MIDDSSHDRDNTEEAIISMPHGLLDETHDPARRSWVAAANLPGNVLATLLMDRIGRRSMLVGSLVLACGATVGFAFANTAASAVAGMGLYLVAVSIAEGCA